ncbi:MAG: hypothetical protein R3E31_17875 [Chloroflexota bacterium]
MKIPIHKSARLPGGETAGDVIGCQAFWKMIALAQQLIALVLKLAWLNGFAREHGHACVVVQFFAKGVVPLCPARNGFLHHRHVRFISAILHAHHFADVGGGR